MKTCLFLIGFLVLALVTAGGLSAQQTMPQGSGQAGQSSGSQMLITKAETLKGSEVYNRKGEKLGTVESIALDLQNGRISYVVINPGSGDRLVPVPFDMVGVTKGKTLVLNMDKNHFAKAPGFAKKNEPSWADAGWTNWVSSFWGTAPSGVMTAQAGGSQQQTKPYSAQQQPQQMGAQQQQPMQQAPMGQQAGPGQPQPGQQPMTGQQPPYQGSATGSQPVQQPMGSQPSGTQPPGSPMGGQQ